MVPAPVKTVVPALLMILIVAAKSVAGLAGPDGPTLSMMLAIGVVAAIVPPSTAVSGNAETARGPHR